MDKYLHSFKKICILTLLSITLPSQAQTIQWESRPDKVYVFEINNKEAEKLLKSKPQDSLILKMLHNHVASYSKVWEDAPRQGHFIHAHINKNAVDYFYEPIIPFKVFLFKEYGILNLQVIDAEGKIRDNAKVSIKGKWRLFDTGVSYDKETQTYRIDDWSEKRERILTVELDKFKAIFDLTKHLVNPWHGGYNRSGSSPEFYSYMITDKNKYKPGETVRFKSYALSERKRPLKNDLEVWMRTSDSYNSYKKITTLPCYHPGGFAGEVELHDSLKLKLDKSYNIQLRDNKGRIVSNANFRYEDYELYDTSLEVKIQNSIHYSPDSNKVEIKVTDANGLIVPDSKADILIKRRHVQKAYTDLLILSDTLMSERINLDNGNTTIFEIPSHIFGQSDCSYDIEIEVLTYDNQKLNYRNNVLFYYSNYDIVHKTRNDTIRFEFYELGKEKEVEAEIKYAATNETKIIKLPHEEPFNQANKGYTFKVLKPNYSKIISSRDIYSNLELEGGFAKDSFNVKLINPLQLEVSWYVYKGNILLQKGSGTEIDFNYPNTELDVAHYVEVFYFMGEEERILRRVFVPKTEYLSVDIDLPDRVYPGQKMNATISVKNNWGSPVKDVDLTAFATNSLLNHYVPDLPYYGAPPRTREQRADYSIEGKDFSYHTPLKWEFWNKLVGLDRFEYYQFTYPWHKIFTYAVNTPDSTTQFAPYVMKDGNAVDIYVIESNNIPLYFSWTDQPKGYSFIVSDDREQRIYLRLHDRVLILDSVRLEPGKKTILSIDLDHLPENVVTTRIGNREYRGRQSLTPREKEVYGRYISRFPIYGYIDFSYLKQGKVIYPLYHACLQNSKTSVLAGPLPEGRSQYLNNVEYRHEGGFRYAFEGNVVYKYPENVFPDYLKFSSGNNFSNLNDFCLTAKVFNKKIEECKTETNHWHPTNIYISQSDMILNFSLPHRKDSTGVSNLLFRNRVTNKILFPDKLENNIRKYSEIPVGRFDVILLYNSGDYLEYKDVPFNKYTYTELNMQHLNKQYADSISRKWLTLSTYPVSIGTQKPIYNERSGIYYTRSASSRKGANSIKGFLYDPDGEPLIGATVSVKGTKYGTITDIDGYFDIEADAPNTTLQFMYIGYVTKEMKVTPGSQITVTLNEDVQMLDEIVVIGYGVQRRANLTGAIAGISSNDAAPQAKPEELEDTEETQSEEISVDDAEDRLYTELMQLSGLRSNFSDVGFWEPRLYTDRKGKAQLTVTFPDNITQWNAVVYAMNRKLKTGTLRKSIKSYKPLMAEVRMPQFMVEGDSSNFAGNIRNYTKDKEINGNIMFAIENDTVMNKNIDFTSSHQDKMQVTAPFDTDSLTTTYLFSRNDGYKDGEQRTIPIEMQGTELADGYLAFLQKDVPQTAKAEEDEKVHVIVTGKQLDVYMNATYYLTGYKYACNEQLASKLIGLLNYKIYKQYLGEKFTNDKNVNEIIKRLVNNRNDKQLWSWWGNSSNTSYWMSAHIMRALRMAKEAGYTVKLDLKKVENDYIDLKSLRRSSLYDIQILHSLSEWGTEQNYGPAIEEFEKEIKMLEISEDSIARANNMSMPYRRSYLKEKLLLWEIRQKQNIGYQSDSISKYMKKDVIGGVYCDDGIPRYWYSDNLNTTLIAYRIVKNDSTLHHLVEPMQMYILGTKSYGWNTYQASSAVGTVLPDLLAQSYTEKHPATVILTGKENRQLTEFPYETTLRPGEYLNIEKKDGMPLIYSEYTIKRQTKARSGEAFEISSTLSEGGDIVTAGKPFTLTVEVKVKQKNAEHVMIEVPIPAGCSYASKPNYFYGREVHREYFKEKTVIFCESLPMGTYKFDIQLLPRYTGRYIMNPAKAELMYFPTINANNDLRRITIDERD